MTGPDEAPLSRVLAERLRLIMAIVRRDLGQLHRHGLVPMVVLAVVLLLVGGWLFGQVRNEIDKRGAPSWTGSILGGEGGDDGGGGDGGGGGLPYIHLAADVLVGPAPLTVDFEPTYVNLDTPTDHEWHFGDDNMSTSQAGIHTYTYPGTFGCWLQVREGGGEAFRSGNLHVIVTDPSHEGLQAAPSSSQFEGESPLEVRLASAVAGGEPPYTYLWDLGDGNTSSEANLTHVLEGDGEVHLSLTVEDAGGNVSGPHELRVELWGEGGDGDGDVEVPLTLLDVVFGFAVLVTMLFVPLAFSSSYKHEMKKGTVRTLVCYPVGVTELTLAKLLYAAIVGLVVSAVVFFLVVGDVGKAPSEVLTVFLVAYVVTLVTVAVGALLANSLAYLAKRMVLRPTSVPWLLVLLSFLFTTKVMDGLGWLLGMMGGGDAIPLGDSMSALIALSPYHVGGAILSPALGGPGTAPLLALVVPALLVILGLYLSRRLYPDIYRKE